jgi:MarR-like DNA-binding transcriptional regulator SgrR of sgrS sRNA
LNPLKPLNGNNKYIVNLLYRSVLRYDLSKDKIVSDIASCDISNLLYIECYLENNILWSNGKEINTEDIIATYKILQNTDTNPVIKSLLSETEVS